MDTQFASLAGTSFCGVQAEGKLGDSRNRTLENVVENMALPCTHGSCSFTGVGEVLRTHKTECDHRPYDCPIRNCTWEGPLENVVGHLTGVHKEKVLSESFGQELRRGIAGLPALESAGEGRHPRAIPSNEWILAISVIGQEHYIQKLHRCTESLYADRAVYHSFLQHIGPGDNGHTYKASVQNGSVKRTFEGPVRSIRTPTADLVRSLETLMSPAEMLMGMADDKGHLVTKHVCLAL
jgi:hypothetical protein